LQRIGDEVSIYLTLEEKICHKKEYAFLCIYAPGASITPSTSSKDLAVKWWKNIASSLRRMDSLSYRPSYIGTGTEDKMNYFL
jgi:hypothetical protein